MDPGRDIASEFDLSETQQAAEEETQRPKKSRRVGDYEKLEIREVLIRATGKTQFGID
jgi:hypothetical protein